MGLRPKSRGGMTPKIFAPTARFERNHYINDVLGGFGELLAAGEKILRFSHPNKPFSNEISFNFSPSSEISG